MGLHLFLEVSNGLGCYSLGEPVVTVVIQMFENSYTYLLKICFFEDEGLQFPFSSFLAKIFFFSLHIILHQKS